MARPSIKTTESHAGTHLLHHPLAAIVDRGEEIIDLVIKDETVIADVAITKKDLSGVDQQTIAMTIVTKIGEADVMTKAAGMIGLIHPSRRELLLRRPQKRNQSRWHHLSSLNLKVK